MSDTATYSISNAGVKAIARWARAGQALERATRDLRSAECEMSNSTEELGKWMVPKEPTHTDEQFNVWVGDGLLGCKRLENGNHEVKWRKVPGPETASNITRG